MSKFILHFHWFLLKEITGQFSETGVSVSARQKMVNSLSVLPGGDGAVGDVAAAASTEPKLCVVGKTVKKIYSPGVFS